MHYYKATIQYDGTNYAGFQWQNGLSTVQNEINSSLDKLIDGKFSTMAASRTDTGVHALHQIVKITSSSSVDCTHFLNDFNKLLPADIRVMDFVSCDGSFRPSVESLTKEYRYFFTNNLVVPKEERKFTANISNPLNIEAMMFCIRGLIGTHDFSNFYSRGSNVKSTVRNIIFCELTEIDPRTVLHESELFILPENLKTCFQLRIEANGFLKQMIRHIVSALWCVGSGKISSEDFFRLLNGPKQEKQHWKVAPPNGLFLYQINYR